ncbi:hypothetical protein JDV02_010641 [Purpureocillium takamizusanense]|uniref:N-acetyltransferase domain-containing protein n=1 Tax=Purpureocillium takamizusanense TaxID=2060973 RepID=A0A9Q8QPA5_9HYPO|nr:uncharacterized protein JDV02_010641 [Purpureocillium takamizusanense]UNI24924.1 hypothetical protein JDV02_010641 [Purpureocillium takamizusanense]
MTAKPATPSAMEFIAQEMHDSFKSARLEFVKIDENNEQLKTFIRTVETPFIQALASSSMPIPYGKADVDRIVSLMSKAFLGAAIYLLPSPSDETSHNFQGDAAVSSTQTTAAAVATATRAGSSDGGVLIGTICLGWGGFTPGLVSNRSATIGIALARQYQNNGYGREAIDWMLDWAFRHGGLHTVRIGAFSYNERAAHLYESMGFTLDGRMRDARRFNRQWYDELLFSMTEDEWERLRGI